ncbi:phosphoserine transaminase [Terasakiella pusilla]|uniref:phosphoserine transaminase n=1 Tax=Terasakiella pusilla TaxID=64973 RepID=UPI003AA7C480
MTNIVKPTAKPNNPNFSSGPCSKRPGFTLEALKDAPLGRSHRAKIGKDKLSETITRTKDVLGLPADYRLGIVPASDTGAVEMALWSLLGARGIDMVQWESFGKGWVNDVKTQLKLEDVREIKADYGQIPDLSQVDFSRDVVFTWNGTTSGVCVPNGDWIAADREGLTICDATSAVFAMDIAWDKIDVLTYSWQKVMGGEGAHGVLVLSPRAVERLESYTPPWPLPKIFRMTKSGKLIEGIFTGETINTPSMLCVEDALDGLRWAEEIGGLSALKARSQANLAVLENWIAKTDGFEFLAADKAIRSNTSVCLLISADWFKALDEDEKTRASKKLVALMEAEGAAFDIGSYRDAPAGLRIWCGATVEADDLKLLTPWLDWGLSQIAAEYA